MIYFDYAATTPIDKEVVKEMLPYMKNNYGNASSIHQIGQKARIAIDNSREKLAKFFNCQTKEIIFTGSATEANNLAIFGLIRKFIKEKPHIITSGIEHPAVIGPCSILEQQGVKVSYIQPNKEGIIELKNIKKEIKENTRLISIMYANNEIGTIQPIKEIGNLIKELNKKRKNKIYFHTDAVQAVNYLDCDVKKLGVDLLSMSSHKIYGPKGIGCLFIKTNTPIEPIIFGGGHEFGLRSGTENTAGIVGLGKAIELVQKHKKDTKRIQSFRDEIIKKSLEIKGSRLNGSKENRLPHNINLSFLGVEGESLLLSLDEKGIAVSTGSACSSKKLKPSHVLTMIGLSPKEAQGSLRITLGRHTTKQEIQYFLKILPETIKKLRDISPFKL